MHLAKLNLLKIALAIFFFLCLLDMPYGYYQLIRIIAIIGFAILAYQADKNNHKAGVILYIGLGILFQPFIKVALGKEIWNIVDVIVGIALLITIFINPVPNSK